MDFNNYFSKCLSKDVFAKCKDNITKYSNTLRILIEASLENKSHKIGIFASDADCYFSFSSIFEEFYKKIYKEQSNIIILKDI